MPLRKIDDEQNFHIDLAACANREADELESLDLLIPEEQRLRFVQTVFRGDSAGFDGFLAQLEEVPDWSEAHRLMQGYFQSHRINPYHDETVRLSGAIYKRYFPLDRYV